MIKNLKELAGIDLSIYNRSFLEKTIYGRMAETTISSIEGYATFLNNDIQEMLKLKIVLNNHFSEFFRETFTFSYLEHLIIPALAAESLRKNNREIRIWSAACAAGQEAYSIAMLCDEFLKRQNTLTRFRIFATDISEDEVEKAKLAVYHESAIKNVTFGKIKDYFGQLGNDYQVLPTLKEAIDFSTFDLLNKKCDCPPPSIFGNFDIIFCANILFYYNPKIQREILSKLDKCLASGGYLVVGEAESNQIESKTGYKRLMNASIFQKPYSGKI